MTDLLYRLVRPGIMALDPERAHELALAALESPLAPGARHIDEPALRVRVFGLDFPNPLGLAAGFDKDARVPDAVLRLGFGHVEVGSATPLPQPGNPRPRIFRLPADSAVINRMGFNSQGHEAAARRLAARRRVGIVGVNLGANKDSPDRVDDYVRGLERLGPFADYVTINVSSPNTPGLRDLQLASAMGALMQRLMAAREKMTGRKPPIVVKLSPDMAEADLADTVRRLMDGGADGIAVSNTTLSREGLSDPVTAKEAGGLSGRPLFRRSTRMLARARLITEGRIPLIGIGGVDCAAAALEKIRAGASLVQLYTAMIYEGPSLATRILGDMAGELKRQNVASIGDIVGTDAERLAAG